MAKIKVTIEERISQTFEIEALDIFEAVEKAEEMYYDGDLVVDNGEVNEKFISAVDPETNEYYEEEEF